MINATASGDQALPPVFSALHQLSALLDADTMRSLNWEVVGNGREADEAARKFLDQNGLIGS